MKLKIQKLQQQLSNTVTPEARQRIIDEIISLKVYGIESDTENKNTLRKLARLWRR